MEKEETPGMSVVSSFLQVRVVELTVFTLHASVTVLPSSSTTTSGDDIEIAVGGECFGNYLFCNLMTALFSIFCRKT